MALTTLPTDHLRNTRFGQELLAEGEARGEALLNFAGLVDLAAWLAEQGS